jgi:hypothetical protein
LRPGAVQRWAVTEHERASIAGACDQLALAGSLDHHTERGHSGQKHKESSPSIIQSDETAVLKLFSVIEAWTNPFTYREQNMIVNLSSGVVATTPLQQDPLNAFDVGEKAMNEFIEKRLESSNTSFHDAIPWLNLKVFSSLSSPVKIGSKELVITADGQVFARLLVAAHKRSIDLRKV